MKTVDNYGEYVHKRHIKWLKIVNLWYLSTSLIFNSYTEPFINATYLKVI
jgi:hypothetical protein